ncbi:MAG: hypothetical protein CME93_02365 [Hyphomonadaceae bacterium]|nr:hypothetical protein [Hyphomonadaceae bacterium]OUX94268.1 MAG: hypothetical protein CBB77_03955 [Hyphomonas sp. TMED17]
MSCNIATPSGLPRLRLRRQASGSETKSGPFRRSPSKKSARWIWTQQRAAATLIKGAVKAKPKKIVTGGRPDPVIRVMETASAGRVSRPWHRRLVIKTPAGLF